MTKWQWIVTKNSGIDWWLKFVNEIRGGEGSVGVGAGAMPWWACVWEGNGAQWMVAVEWWRGRVGIG